MNATTKSSLRVGNSTFSLSPEFGSVSVRKRVGCNGQAKDYRYAASLLTVNLLKLIK